MAGLDQTLPLPNPPRHDGVAACRVCASADAEAAHGWCPAVGGLVCDSCCRRTLFGDDTRLYVAAATDVDGDDAAEALARTCLHCERGQSWFEEQLRQRIAPGPKPC